MPSFEENAHETQFAGWATALWSALIDCCDGRIAVSPGLTNERVAQYQRIIAVAAYDLVLHTVHSLHSSSYDTFKGNEQALVDLVDDLPDWVPGTDTKKPKKTPPVTQPETHWSV